MKKTLFTLSLSILAMLGMSAFAQSEATTPRMSFHIAKEVKPPLWEILEEPYFVDADGNHAVDANEECKIVMKIKNIGMGDGAGLTAKISAEGTRNGITVHDQKLPTVKVGATSTVEFPISANMNTADGSVDFTVYVEEPMGFSTDKYTVKVQSRAFQAPMIEVKDYVATCEDGGKLVKMKKFQLQVLIQNTRHGLGENVKVTLKRPENVYNLDGQDSVTIPRMGAGESKTLTYTLVVNNQYSNNTLPLQVLVQEKYGKYAQNKTITLELNQTLVNRSIEVASQVAPQADIVEAQLRSDVDRNIPDAGKKNSHRYALIIGNEDYHSYQKGLNMEQDVPFAAEDARIFKEYCVKTLGVEEGNGVEESNIVILTNATAAKMSQEIDYITSLAAIDPQAEIVFYYAGHGYPDESSKEPYLIPVDVNAANLTSALSLYELYEKLTASGAKRVTVFLDACFSGGGRDAGLVASRGIRVTPRKDVLTGNLVVFSATSADQTALPYSEKQHGMFTYFLLKKLQSSNGTCSYSELYQYLKENVRGSSFRVNRKDQTPEVNTSAQVQDSWGGWRFD